MKKPKLYLIPGLATDYRVFNKLDLEKWDATVLKWEVPEKDQSLKEFAKTLSKQIDPSEPFYLLGFSFGGMLAIEIAKIYPPVKLILISTIKTVDELPLSLKLTKYFPIYRLLNEKFIRRGSRWIKRVLSRMEKKEVALFIEMLNSMPPGYLKNSVHCIVNWDNKEEPQNYIHLHGSLDRIFPVDKIKNAQVIKNGTHFMVFKNSEVNKYLNSL